MKVKVLNFGSNWWSRFGRDKNDLQRYTRHAAFYNSTGVRCGRKVRRHWLIAGLIRFNGDGVFNPDNPEHSIGATFSCTEPEFAFGGNRLLFERRLSLSVVPDRYLVVVSQPIHGRIDLTAEWKVNTTMLIAVSERPDNQEIMLLMKLGEWLSTRCGIWQLQDSSSFPSGAGLELMGDGLPS